MRVVPVTATMNLNCMILVVLTKYLCIQISEESDISDESDFLYS